MARHWLAASLAALACVGARAAAPAPAPPKHVVFIVVDDLGWGDVSYKAATYPAVPGLQHAPPTPHIDALALAGVRLESYYVHPLCSPSRAAFLSGRYAYTTGSNSEVIVDGVPDQLPTNYRTVADLLLAAGWNTSAYGKWDLGSTTWGCTPGCRGFQHFSGFYNAFNDYFTHRVGPGLDLRRDFSPDANETGVYMTQLITQRVSEWITGVVAGGGAGARSFAYVAHQAIHAPQQVPMEFVQRCADAGVVNVTDQPIRAIACGQMVAVDDSVGAVVARYDHLGLLNDTLFIFSADNGPNTDTGGSGWPLRGMKATVFEGGIRGVGFVSGAGLAPAVQGTINNELYSLVDWLPTIVHGIAGVDLAQAALPKHAYQPPPPALDGLDVWASVSQGGPSPRSEALLQLDPTACFAGAGNTPCNVPGQGAFRAGQWKLLVGHTSVYAGPGNVTSAFCGPRDGVVQRDAFPLNVTVETTPPFCPTGWVPPPGSGLPIVPPPEESGPGGACAGGVVPCLFFNSALNSGGVWLFDVVNDPWEHHNVAAEHADIVATLMAKLQAFNATRIPQQHSAADPASAPDLHHGVWTPWRGNPAPAVCDPNTTVPGGGLRSALDGVTWAGAAAGASGPSDSRAVSASVAGWAWDPLEGGGRTQLNVSVAMDGALVGWAVASVDRPGLPAKTGAPDPFHGFVVALPPAVAAAGAHGKHAFAVTAHAEGADVPLVHSPVCYCDAQRCAC